MKEFAEHTESEDNQHQPVSNIPMETNHEKEVSGINRSSVYLEDNRSKPIQRQSKPNNTGLPDQLKSGAENLSGHSMDDVKVHYNSSKPAQLNAHAFAQGNQIHIASGQEKHLPHETWHVVQQKQGRVEANKTIQAKESAAINDDESLEKEADTMGASLSKFAKKPSPVQRLKSTRDGIGDNQPVQRVFDAHGKIYSSMKDVADDPVMWASYSALTVAQKAIFRVWINDHVRFPLHALNEFATNQLQFNGQSGTTARGRYKDIAHANPQTNLQSNDAEVHVLNDANAILRKLAPAERRNLNVILYMKISKGPCDSCRGLIRQFMHDFPGVKVVVQYAQAQAHVKEQVGKDRGQKALGYGYASAKSGSAGGQHIKVLHPDGELDVPRVIGQGNPYLMRLLGEYHAQHGWSESNVAGFVARIGKHLIPDAHRAEVIRWMGQMIINEQRTQPTAEDVGQLRTIPAADGGRQVQAYGYLRIS